MTKTTKSKNPKVDNKKVNTKKVKTEVKQEVVTPVETEVKQEVVTPVKTEVKQEVVTPVETEVKQEVVTPVETEVKQEVITEVTPEVKQEVETEVKQEVETEVKQEVETEVKQEVKPVVVLRESYPNQIENGKVTSICVVFDVADGLYEDFMKTIETNYEIDDITTQESTPQDETPTSDYIMKPMTIQTEELFTFKSFVLSLLFIFVMTLALFIEINQTKDIKNIKIDTKKMKYYDDDIKDLIKKINNFESKCTCNQSI